MRTVIVGFVLALTVVSAAAQSPGPTLAGLEACRDCLQPGIFFIIPKPLMKRPLQRT